LILERPDHRCFYDTAGRGPAVLAVQGVGVIGEGWRPQIEALRSDFTFGWFDNRGIGRSSFPAGGDLSISSLAEDALAVADALGFERFHVLGHSMGGLIAQQVALRAPARIRSLALLCTFARGSQGARFSLPMLWTALRMRLGPRAHRRNAFLELVMPAAHLRAVDRAVLAGELAVLFGHDLAEQPAIVFKQVQAMSRFDVSSSFAELSSIRTLVVSATHDRIALPSDGRELASLIPGARFLEIEEAGHALPIQEAAKTNALLREHWQAADST